MADDDDDLRGEHIVESLSLGVTLHLQPILVFSKLLVTASVIANCF